MYRGETVTTTISGFPIPIEDIKELHIVFRNDFKVLLEKTLADCKISEEVFNGLEFTLSQEDSLQLTRGKIARSVVIITKNGDRIESCPSYIMCGQTARNGVI